MTEGRGAHASRASREGRGGGCPWALLHPPGRQFDGQLVWELPGKLWLSSAATVPKRCHPPPLQAQCPSPACSPLSPSWGVGPARPQQVMQWLPCHLGASNITPCPFLSVRAAALQGWSSGASGTGAQVSFLAKRRRSVCWFCGGCQWESPPAARQSWDVVASSFPNKAPCPAPPAGSCMGAGLSLPRAMNPVLLQPQTSRAAASPHQGLAGSWKNLSGFNRLWSKAPGRELTCPGRRSCSPLSHLALGAVYWECSASRKQPLKTNS